MSILSDFEDRVGGAVEGLFAGAFRSPVQPVELAKSLARAMDDGRMVGVSKVYAPVAYTVALSPEDTEKMASFQPVLAGELATYLVGHAREHDYSLSSRPQVAFDVHDDLKLGRFRVSAEHAHAPEASVAGTHLGEVTPIALTGAASSDYDGDEGWDDDEWTPGLGGGLDTVSVSGVDHDIALRGDRMVIGRLKTCDICLSDVNVSREHAELVRLDDGWYAVDLDSTNGLTVNEAPVERARLENGDVIGVGLTRLTYHRTGR